MKKCSLNQVKSIINSFEEKGLKYIDTLGSKSTIISDGVVKYSTYESNIKHFIVFDNKNMKKEISFYFDGCALNYSDIKNELGQLEVHYNFRENYSEFKINLPSSSVPEIYFIKNNRYEVVGENKFIEVDPQGRKIDISMLVFEGFCLRVVTP